MQQRYKVEHFTVCDGWIPFGTDEEGKPETYATSDKAEQELDTFLADCREAGMDYDRSEFRITATNTRTTQ